MKFENKYIVVDDDVSILKIKSNTHGIFEILIDTKNIDKCKIYHWSVNKFKSNSNSGRAYFYIVNKKIGLLHRYITDCPKGMVVDHIDGDTLNNTNANLQIVDKKDNERKARMPLNNTSGVTGVTWNKVTKSWMAFLKFNSKFINLGYYDNIEDAAKARRIGELKYFGEFTSVDNTNTMKENFNC